MNKKMKKLLIAFAFLIVAGITVTSCIKDSKQPDPGYNVVADGTNTSQLLEAPLDVFLQVDRAIRSQHDSIVAKNINQASLTYKIGYISLTVAPADTVTYPKTLTVDFGTDTTNTYQGKMVIKILGNMKMNGSKSAISYVNLYTGKSNIVGTDSVISSGVNASNSVVTRYNMHGGKLMGYGSKLVNYDGRVIAKYNLTSKANVMDSVEINATDADLVGYKIYSVANYKLIITKDCNYFSTGIILTDIKINNVLTGNLVYDYSYSQSGTTGGCDADGSISAYSYVNKNYQQFYLFAAKKFL